MTTLNQLQLISQVYSHNQDDSDDDNFDENKLIKDNFIQDDSVKRILYENISKDITFENNEEKTILNHDSTNDPINKYMVDNNVNNKCLICLSSEFKYKCPSCLVRTCSLICFKQHKVTLHCSGLRNSLKFKRMSNFDDNQLRTDIYFLEDHDRQLDGIKRQKRNIVQSLNDLPNWLKKLKYEANRRSIRLKILPAGFKRRLQNKTTFMYSTKEIHWDIDLIFTDLHLPKNIDEGFNHELIKSSESINFDLNERSNPNFSQSKKITFHIQRVSEKQVLNDLLNAYLKPENLIENNQLNSLLKFYQNANEDEIKILIKLSFGYYLELNPQMTINDCLKNKTIIEYPTILVILKKNLYKFKLVKENELKNKMQEYADKSYDLFIKNKEANFDGTNFLNPNKSKLCENSELMLNTDEKKKYIQACDSLYEENIDNLLDKQHSINYGKELDDDDTPLEVKIKCSLNNSYDNEMID